MPTTNPTLYHPQARGCGLKAVTGPSTGNLYLVTFDGIIESCADSDVAGFLAAGWGTRPPGYYINQSNATTNFGLG
jgi:hypothetical protein